MESRRNQGYIHREQVGKDAEGVTVLAWLCNKYPHGGSESWTGRIAAGEVRIGTSWVEPARLLKRGEWLSWHRPPWEEAAAPRSYGLIYEDENLLVIDKPAGLTTIPSGGFLENTLLSAVREFDAGASPMHRLGTGTSGLVLFARNAPAGTLIQEAFRDGRVTRRYRGVARGRVSATPWTVNQPIGPVPHATLGTIHAASAEGRPAVTHVTLLRWDGEDSVVGVEIETGRPHQIRIHLAWCGHPLVGDPLYRAGGGVSPDARPTEGGYQLHASELVLDVPAWGPARRFEVGAPWEK